MSTVNWICRFRKRGVAFLAPRVLLTLMDSTFAPFIVWVHCTLCDLSYNLSCSRHETDTVNDKFYRIRDKVSSHSFRVAARTISYYRTLSLDPVFLNDGIHGSEHRIDRGAHKRCISPSVAVLLLLLFVRTYDDVTH